MIIRTALLCVPAFDEEAIGQLRQLLREQLPAAVVLQVDHTTGQRNLIEERLRRWCDEAEIDLVLTIGGTLPAPGPGRHEWVPEATQSVSERIVPGLAELMRQHAAQESPLAWLERGVAGIRGRSLIVNLPAGAAAALLCLQAIIALFPPLFDHLQEDPMAPRLADDLEILPTSPPTLPTDNPNSTLATAVTSAPASGATGLNAAEFAAFLQRRNPST